MSTKSTVSNLSSKKDKIISKYGLGLLLNFIQYSKKKHVSCKSILHFVM